MDTKDTYKAYKHEVGKDVLKTLAFVFIGIPILLFLLAIVLMS